MLAERHRPVADVFWNNEIVRSIQLKAEGITEAYSSPSAATIPAGMKDPEGHWAGFAARARVILVNTEILADPAGYPRSVQDLIDPRWKGRASFGRPLFGTTSTHAAVMYAREGEAGFRRFWQSAFANAVMVPGNAQSRDTVADGELAWCLTDTDDAQGAILEGKPVRTIYPDSGPEGSGVLVIPNTVVLIKGAPHREEGKALIDYLLSEEVEAALAQSRSAQIPLRSSVTPPAGLESLSGHKVMAVDWVAVQAALVPSQKILLEMGGDR